MKKRISFICLAVLFAMSLSACSFKPGPEKTVEKYCESMKRYDVDGMKTYTVAEIQSDNDTTTEDSPFTTVLSDYFKDNIGKLSYTVGKPTINGDTATVQVDFTYVDAGPIYKAAIGDMLSKAFALALSGSELSDEESEAMFKAAFEEQKEKIDPITSTSTVEFPCTKTDDGWQISKVDDKVLNIMTANLIGSMAEIGSAFGGESDSAESADASDEIRVDKKAGDVVELATIKITITDHEECQELVPEYGEKDVAPEGTKFVIVHAEIENITTETINFSGSTLTLIDGKDRRYEFYDDAMFALDDTFGYRDLAPNIKETGTLVYKVPSDSTDYSIMVGKAGTNEVYYIAVT